jgi:hypothetical protein
MPKNKVSDPITDQEIAFARLVLSGTMTDRQAAEAVGLNPDSAAYTKSKSHVRAYMLEHRAAVEHELVQQEVDLSRRAVEGLHRLSLDRKRVLDRLWEIANLSPEMTRGSITGQVKALSMIIAMENFIPDRRAVSSQKKSPTAPANPPQGYAPVGLARQQATTMEPQPSPAPGSPAPARRGAAEAPPDQIELSSRVPRLAVGPERPVPACRGSVVEGPAVSPNPSQSTSPNRVSPSKAPLSYVPLFNSVPDLGVPFSIKNPFVHLR